MEMKLSDKTCKKVELFRWFCMGNSCNSVLNPGTVIGKILCYPLSCVRGVVPSGHF